jgi:hypothetical protein
LGALARSSDADTLRALATASSAVSLAAEDSIRASTDTSGVGSASPPIESKFLLLSRFATNSPPSTGTPS